MREYNNITDVPGIRVGNIENHQALTGCTVILTENSASCGVDVRGSAPGTRETDALDPINAIGEVHAICLSGGSAYGLEAASGVMKFLEEQDIGFAVGTVKVPIVPSAVIFDLHIGDPKVRPDLEMGYKAASQARAGDFPQGNVGAGCGATVGKIPGPDKAMKSGLGSTSVQGADDLVVGAIVSVNAVGDVRDPETNRIIAGAIHQETKDFINSIDYIKKNPVIVAHAGANTTIGAIAMNAKLTKAEAKKIAGLAQNALARTIFPVHTMADGDTIFVLGTGTKKYSVDYLGTLAEEAMEKAILKAVKAAEPVHDMESYSSLKIIKG
ncbi:peptidase S58 family protein [Oceanobacillus piezotolerans]|uniref:Peptidase S58 family protein n=1 Tax=Oceanobacillus piezotolerans TaxID=2448030 RepID=A0A498DGN0_9BACI|nr:P1 family peptidase [Oceanobacillus piezotolerans]RLL43802.1 peptidase S58 family protein [Oceanobacillus piezotolerans]